MYNIDHNCLFVPPAPVRSDHIFILQNPNWTPNHGRIFLRPPDKNLKPAKPTENYSIPSHFQFDYKHSGRYRFLSPDQKHLNFCSFSITEVFHQYLT